MGVEEVEAARAAVLDLSDPRACDPATVGAKAANLARAAGRGLPVLEGFVIAAGARPEAGDLRARWERLTDGGARDVIVRSSSTVEDDRESSMAGQFRSVLDVRGWDAFEDAVQAVLASASGGAVGAAGAGDAAGAAPMGVLVQVQLRLARSGVLFALDPVTGDSRHLMAAVVRGSPHPLVSGTVTGERYVLSRRGHLVSTSDPPRERLSGGQRRALARLAHRVEVVFGSPQDVEWGFDDVGRLWLLQSRPVTAKAAPPEPHGPLLGRGPVSETFPYRLRPLEVDLWVAPLRQGLSSALRTVGAASRRHLASSPVVAMVDGWAAADLDLLGPPPSERRLLRLLDPRGPARHLRVAWQVGSLRSTLPALAAATVRRVDAGLRRVPPLAELSDGDLLRLLQESRPELATVHRREVLAGMLLEPSSDEPTGAALALTALAEGRRRGDADPVIVACAPVVLALTAPRVGFPAPLPAAPADVLPAQNHLDSLTWREALRLRARWLEELTARAATELGARLAEAGVLASADEVAALTLRELATAVAGGPLPADLAARTTTEARPPLPPAFRLTADGQVVAVLRDLGAGRAGQGAGGGRGVGTVSHADGAAPRRGEVLVVETMSPELAAVLPGLAGLVSETGSPLSHLAILAREMAVPTVVGVAGARGRFPPGTTVVVDGRTGEVSVLEEADGDPVLDRVAS
jgi:phosphohistidine swiveling domain-containing protein